MDDECLECGSSYLVEEHHVVFRSQNKLMVNVEINKIKLCNTCHRGNNGPHLNKESDLKYKRKLQNELFEMFGEYVTVEEIKKNLKVTPSTARKMVRTLRMHKEGYYREDVVRYMMGGKLY